MGACRIAANLGEQLGHFVTSSRYQFSLLSLPLSKQNKYSTGFSHIGGVFAGQIEMKSYVGRDV